MSSKFLISSDSISWTLAKPAMLVVAAVGGIGGHGVQERAFAPPVRPPQLRPTLAPGFLLDPTAPALKTATLTAVAVPGARLAQRARPAVATAVPAVPEPADSADFVQAFPETPEMSAVAAEPAVEPAPGAQFAVTTWGAIIPAIQQTISPASDAGETDFAAQLSNLRLPQPAEPAPTALPESAIAAPVDAVQFISVAVVQPVPQLATAPTAAAKPELALGAVKAARVAKTPKIAPTTAAPVPADRAELVSKAASTPAQRFAAAPAQRPLAGSMNGNKSYSIKDNVIEFALAARVNGAQSGAIGLRVTADDRLWLRLGDLLEVVRAQMAPAEFARFSASARAGDYVEFDTVRQAGIDLRYDAAHNQIALGVE